MKTTFILTLLGLTLFVGCREDDRTPAPQKEAAVEGPKTSTTKVKVDDTKTIKLMQDMIVAIKKERSMTEEKFNKISDDIDASKMSDNQKKITYNALKEHQQIIEAHQSTVDEYESTNREIRAMNIIEGDLDADIRQALEEMNELFEDKLLSDNTANGEYMANLENIANSRDKNDPQVKYLKAKTKLSKMFLELVNYKAYFDQNQKSRGF